MVNPLTLLVVKFLRIENPFVKRWASWFAKVLSLFFFIYALKIGPYFNGFWNALWKLIENPSPMEFVIVNVNWGIRLIVWKRALATVSFEKVVWIRFPYSSVETISMVKCGWSSSRLSHPNRKYVIWTNIPHPYSGLFKALIYSQNS